MTMTVRPVILPMFYQQITFKYNTPILNCKRHVL